MAFDLSGFKTALEFGGARPSLFEFVFTATPTGIDNGLESMQLYCNVTEIPPLTVTPIERQYFGRTVKIPGDMTFGDLSTDIVNTESFQVRNEIEKWMEFINGTTDNKSQADADFGTGTAKLTHYQKNGDETMVYQFEDIWPTTLSEIALSYDTASDIEQFDVTWAYNYFTMSGTGVTTGQNTQG